MNEILRNLARRKVRSVLTISGIVIGIFALTTMGALAEHFNSLLNVGVQYAGSAINVGAQVGQQTTLLPVAKATLLEKVQGVAAVYPIYNVSADPGGSEISFGPPDMIVNEQPGASAYGAPAMTFSSGRDLAANERGEVVLGSAMASQLGSHVGDTVDLPIKPKDAGSNFINHPFTVVGILGKSGAAVDTFAYVSGPDAQMLLKDSLPAQVTQSLDVSTVAQGFAVYPAKGTSLSELDQIAARINQEVPGVHAKKPSDAVTAFKSTGTTFTAVTTGAALLALIIGGLSVVNTMIMAVGERIREIGLKKALGAKTGQIMREYLLESMTIGAIGGVVGYLIGVGITFLVNHAGGSQPLDIFLVTPRLTVASLGFAVGLAAGAGIFPAFRAARLDPVVALRTSG